MQIQRLRGLTVKELAKRSINEFSNDSMSTYAAALAFTVLFALFPFLIFLIALLGFLQLSAFFDWLINQARLVVPQQAMGQIEEVIRQIQQEQRPGLLSFGIIVALWSASSGIRALMDALNKAYDVEEARPAWKRYLLSVVYTIAFAVMLIAAAALMLLGPQVIGWLTDQIGLGQAFVIAWAWLRWPVAVALLIVATAIIYYAAPNADVPFRLITPGAIIAVVVWVLASLGFAFYIAHFANYSATYGSLGAVVILLFYFYISAMVLLFGAEVNGVIEDHAHPGPTPHAEEPGAEREAAPGQLRVKQRGE